MIFRNPAAEGSRDAIVNAENDMHDVTIRDLVVEGALKTDPGTDPNSNRSFRSNGNRGGIIFRLLREGQMKNLHFVNLTVQNCTYNGVFVSGASRVEISRCDFVENGSIVVPGPKLQHNLLITHSNQVSIKDSRLDTSPFGSGIAVSDCSEVSIASNELPATAITESSFRSQAKFRLQEI